MNVRVLENKLRGDSLFSGPTLHAALSDLPHNEAAPALLEIAENAEQRRRGLLRKAIIVFVHWFVVFCGLKFLPIVYPSPYKFWWQILGAVWPLSAFIIGRFFSPRKILQTQQNAVAALLLCPHDPRFLPPLVDGLQTPKTPEWQSLLYPALTTALWNAPDDELILRLDAPRRNALRAFIAYDLTAARSKTRVSTHFDDATTDLTVAALRTLLTVGDKKTVKLLHRIIRTDFCLRNETVVRDAAREFLPILQKRIEENEKIYEYLRTLAGKAPHASYAAIAEYVDTLAAQDVRPVLAEFLMEQNRRTVRSRWLSGGGLLVVFAALGLACSSLIRYPSWIGVAFVVFAALISRCMRILWRPHSEVGAGKIAYELAKRSGDDTRVLPILLRAHRKPLDKKQADAVQKAVLHLLPLLRAGDAALVAPTLRPLLRAWLTMPRGALGRAAKSKAVVALAALAAIGDTDALRRVEAVIRYAETVRRGDTLRQSAARCRDALQSRKPF